MGELMEEDGERLLRAPLSPHAPHGRNRTKLKGAATAGTSAAGWPLRFGRRRNPAVVFFASVAQSQPSPTSSDEHNVGSSLTHTAFSSCCVATSLPLKPWRMLLCTVNIPTGRIY